MRYSVIVLLLAASSVLAAGPSHWTHTSEAEFKKGKFRNVVASNLGDVKLSRAVKTLLEQDPRVSSVYCLAEGPDGAIYAGTGPHGIILQLKGEKVTTLATLEDENVFALLVDKDGQLLAGTGGERGRIVRIDKPGEKPVEVFAATGVQYVWQIRQTPDGVLYAGTGANGQVFQINPDGTKSVLLESDENNILSLISDGKDLLYAGTDPNGLVYKINRKTKEVFVLFDAPEAEVSALALDGAGNLYAGTGQAPEAEDGGGDDRAATEKTGRPDGGDRVNPLPSTAPAEPKPPVAPRPSPAEPNPIPRGVGSAYRPSEVDGEDGGEYTSMAPRLASAPVKQGGEHARGGEHFGMLSGVPLGMAPKRGSTAGTAVAHGYVPLGMAPGGEVWLTMLDGEGALAAAPAPAPSPVPVPAPAGGARKRLAPPPSGVRPPVGPAQPTVGNAIYRIDPSGFVTEIFRQPVMVLSLIEKDGTLLVGTGSDGLIYQVKPAAEETLVLAKVDPRQVMSMLAAKDGRVILGLANVGGMASMSSGYAAEGSYTSAVLDATQISRFGKIHLQGSLPPGAGLTVATRCGNLREPGERGWSPWSAEAAAAEYLQILTPAGRYFQYRLSFASKDGTSTAVADEVDVAYQLPNLAPQIKSIKVDLAGAAQGGGAGAAPAAAGKETPTGRMRQIIWEAADPNNDAMEYSLYFRAAPAGQWILLQDKLKETQYQWDTRAVADGRYQVKVVASDAKANPKGEGKVGSRISETVVVDNTPPIIGDLAVRTVGRKVKVEARIVDRASTVSGVEYSLDAKDDWQTVAALDNIFDSPEEGVAFSIDELAPGAHTIVLRASDKFGNQAYETVQVTISPPAGK